MKKTIAMLALLLTGCGDDGIDYVASGRCQDQGYAPGTEGYETCLKEERAIRLRQQRDEIERLQKDREEQQMILRR